MNTMTRPVDGELLRLKEEIEQYAIDYGLDFHPVVFEMCDYDTINILAALGGFPNRYPHWRFGMEYDQMYKGYAYGLQKIYEMVVNTNPCYAYLLSVNNTVDQKIVMAHVYGHADFFKHNAWFKNTNRNMMDVMANHGTKIRRYMAKYGQGRVEDFIDKVLSLENLVDVDILFDKTDFSSNVSVSDEVDEFTEDEGVSGPLKSFIRSKERWNNKQKKVGKKEKKVKKVDFEKLPTRDVMLFLLEHGPVEEWESDILGILREEAYYYLPQRLTKIMNEGWASYWHSTIMTQKAARPSDIIHFADHHAGVMQMSQKRLNPYKIGIELFRDIEFRWNSGRFGKEYNDCTDMYIKENWDKKCNLGRQKIFEVRKTHNDITFIDEFFTKDFCERMQIFTYKHNPRTGRNEIDTRDFEAIKQKLLQQLTNFGSPIIRVESANDNNRGELLLRHIHQGVGLDIVYAAETMKNVHAIWKRPVNLASMDDGKEIKYTFDGKEMKVVGDSSGGGQK
ncbi:MAG: SpoVR family protein [Bacteriovoracaceae bacterium]|nr:SpoVR family protein [Bacteriovoracaceae bacterium]